MASLFKSVTITHRDGEGRRCKKGDVGAKPMRVVSKSWYGRYKDADGKVRTVALCTDKSAAKTMLSKIVTDAKMASLGMVDKFVGHRSKALADHLDDYRRYLVGKGDTARHADQTHSRIKAILDGCRFGRIGDLSAAAIVDHLAGLRDAGLAVETSNHYLRAIKAFSTWLQKDGRSGQDPLRFLSRLNPETDRRRKRRSLSAADFASLVHTARSSARTVCGLSGPDRAMLYLVAAYTGWRASELASLTPQSFDSGREAVTTEAAYSKHRRRDELPLHPEVARQARAWMAGKPADAPLWPGRWAADRHGAEMLRFDLNAAGIPYVDAGGRTFDFHALRGQFSSALARAGVHPQSAQRLMRHSDINLTMNAYTHLELVDLKADIDKLPAPPSAIVEPGTR